MASGSPTICHNVGVFVSRSGGPARAQGTVLLTVLEAGYRVPENTNWPTLLAVSSKGGFHGYYVPASPAHSGALL